MSATKKRNALIQLGGRLLEAVWEYNPDVCNNAFRIFDQYQLAMTEDGELCAFAHPCDDDARSLTSFADYEHAFEWLAENQPEPHNPLPTRSEGDDEA